MNMSRKPDYMLGGEGFLDIFADYAIHYGDVALLIIDQQAEREAYDEKVISALDEMGLKLLTATLPDQWPSIEDVKEFWADLEAEHEPNIIISLGRSPVIHFAKALSIMAPYKGHVRDLFMGKGTINLVLPHLTIPLENCNSWEFEQVISDSVSILDMDRMIQFSHKELVPRMVGFESTYQLPSIKQVS